MSDRPPGELPPLVLRCRPAWTYAYGGMGVALLGLGAAALAADASLGDPWITPILVALVLFLLGAGFTEFFLRFCLAQLSLTDAGFALAGPLRATRAVAWADVQDWRLVRRAIGPGVVQVVYGPRRSRLTVPLIYEDSHLLELGLRQRRFPRW